MRNIFLIIVTLFFLASPAHLFAAWSGTCTESTVRCDCTDADGKSAASSDASITDGDLCNTYCRTTNSVSWKYYCGTGKDPVDTGDVTSASLDSLTPVAKEDPAIPVLNVPLPGLSQSDLKGSVGTDVNGYITTNMIGLYVNAVFSYGIVLAALLGVLMLTIAGFQYMTAGGNKSAVTKAKARMSNTIFGLILLMATYTIAFLIDPRTTRFNPLTVENIAAVEYFPPEGEDIDITPNTQLTGDAVNVEGSYLIAGASDLSLDEDALTALKAAGEDFYAKYGYQIYIASAKRDIRKQAELFYNNCLQRGGTCSPITCNPASTAVIQKTGSRYTLVGSLATATNSSTIISGIVANASYGNCPHTSAIAVDLWCNDGGGNYQHDPMCQNALIKTMIDHGFCRLTAEAWHFEYNDKKVSRRCLTSNDSVTYTVSSGTYTPSSDCKRWDFKNNKCVLKK